VSAFKRYRDVVVVGILLAVPFFFLRANVRPPENLSALDRALLRISAPIEFAASSMARGISDMWEGYVYLVDVKADSERLAHQNGRLREQVHKLEQQEAENRQLQRLVQLRESIPGELVSAKVSGKDFNQFFRVTRVALDRGSRNIRPFMPVVSPDGVVGTVLRVNGEVVDVQLTVDALSIIDVEDQRTHARGFAHGTGDPSRYACRVENVDSRDEVEIGDLLVTSGKGKKFPKGLPVAKVTRVVRREPGRDQEIEAEPAVNFSRLDAALIILALRTEDADEPTDTKKVSK
jgi:rod shape-determining protein MreC